MPDTEVRVLFGVSNDAHSALESTVKSFELSGVGELMGKCLTYYAAIVRYTTLKENDGAGYYVIATRSGEKVDEILLPIVLGDKCYHLNQQVDTALFTPPENPGKRMDFEVSRKDYMRLVLIREVSGARDIDQVVRNAIILGRAVFGFMAECSGAKFSYTIIRKLPAEKRDLK